MGYTDFLYPAPDVSYAAGQILDLWSTPQQYNRCGSSEEADALALARDWAAVGEDLRQAFLEIAIQLLEP